MLLSTKPKNVFTYSKYLTEIKINEFLFLNLCLRYWAKKNKKSQIVNKGEVQFGLKFAGT